MLGRLLLAAEEVRGTKPPSTGTEGSGRQQSGGRCAPPPDSCRGCWGVGRCGEHRTLSWARAADGWGRACAPPWSVHWHAKTHQCLGQPPGESKKPKFPAGGQCREQEETNFLMKPCPNLPRTGAGGYAQWQYLRGVEARGVQIVRKHRNASGTGCPIRQLGLGHACRPHPALQTTVCRGHSHHLPRHLTPSG